MGCGYEMACWDCGVRQDVGYGSHTTWLAVDSLEAFEVEAQAHPEWASRAKNVAIRDFLTRHRGHRCEAVSEYIYDEEDNEWVSAFKALRVVEPPEEQKSDVLP